MPGPLARVFVLLSLCLLAACAGPARLSYSPERSSYPAPGPADDPWGPFVQEAATRFDVPAQWIRAVMHQESGGHEYLDGAPITSSAGAMGLMQLMPSTYSDLQAQYGLGDDPYDPHDNIMAGTGYIRQMYDKYGSPGFLAAYNAGPARVDDYLAGQGGLPAETVNYVAAITPHLGDDAAPQAPVEVASADLPARPALPRGPSAAAGCWHDPDVAYDPSEPCTAAPVVEQLPATAPEQVVQPVSYAPAATAIGRFSTPPPPSGMVPAPPPPPPPRVMRAAFVQPAPRSYGGQWAVQVGAFGRVEEARFADDMAMRAAPAVLFGSRGEVMPVGGLGGHPLYRARLAGLDREAAAAACGALRERAMACMAVAPGS